MGKGSAGSVGPGCIAARSNFRRALKQSQEQYLACAERQVVNSKIATNRQSAPIARFPLWFINAAASNRMMMALPNNHNATSDSKTRMIYAYITYCPGRDLLNCP
jgi:hypothetical protein